MSQSQKVKGQGHNALIPENVLRVIALSSYLYSWNFPQRLLVSALMTMG